MKTVQETLKTINEKTLIDNYLHQNPPSFNDFDEKITIGDAKKYAYLQMHQYINHLKMLKIKSNKNQGIFFMQRKMDDGMGIGTSSNLVFIDDLKKKGVEAQSYAFEFTPQAEIMSWWIANNELTQAYLLDLLVEIMEEAFLFGFKQEGLQAEVDTINSRIEEIDKHPDKLISADEFEKNSNFDKQTSEEDDLEWKASEAELKYSEYSRKLELKKIMKELNIKT